MEILDRGIVAVRTSPDSVFISWRLLGTDPEGTGFNLYRGSQKINKKPITGATNYIDKTVTEEVYSVRPVIKKKEQKESDNCKVWTQNYIRIPLNRPVIPPAGFERETRPSNARDNAQDGFTGNVILDAYELDGKQLWRINLGKNIRAGAHYTQFLVYDFDGDGKAEMACKTADGTIDGTGKVVGDSTKDFVNDKGRILNDPEYLTIFSGKTGGALQTVDYIPGRGDVCAWGANECKGNRSDRFLACVAYLDGVHPSPVFCRGYYGRLTIAAWIWRDGELKLKWFFDSNNGHPEYEGQGNHNLSVADVDGDGKDEIVYGSSAYDDNGIPLYTTGMGHGDAMHLSDLDPDIPGLEVWGVKETRELGGVLHSAATGKILFQVPGEGDTGRGNAADIYPDHRGVEMWSSTSKGIYSVKGVKITDAVPSVNFRIYWDGDLQDELLDRSFIDDWNYMNHKNIRLFDASQFGGTSINGTKATPVISPDILGDWREEVIFRGKDNESLLLFTTTIPTQYRMKTLMHDPVYRLGVAWQNVDYNQPPHLGFYLSDKPGLKKK